MIWFYISRWFSYPRLVFLRFCPSIDGMKPLEWLVDLKPEAMYGSALGILSEWLPGEVRKHRSCFFCWGGGGQDQYPSGKLTYPTWGKRNNIIYSKVPWKRGACFFSQEGFFERWIDDDLWIRVVVDLIDFWQWFVCWMNSMMICGYADSMDE